MRKALGIIWAVLSVNAEIFAGVNVDVNSKSITINIESPELGLKNFGGEGTSHLGILNTFYASVNVASGSRFDEFRIPIAVPDEIYSSPDLNKFLEVRFLQKTEMNPEFAASFKNILLKESCRLEKYGVMRGIKTAIVVINPFVSDLQSNKVYIFNSINIKVNLPVVLPVHENFDLKESGLFSVLANPGHVQSLVAASQSRKKSSNEIQSGDYWYDPAKTYLRIITTKDGIAVVKAEDMINSNASFSGKPVNKLVMLHRGIEIPIFINKDTDGILNSGDEIIFAGSRPAGDTLWYDHYTKEEPFFIYYDENSNPVRYTAFPEVTGSVKSIEYVEINRHIEYDKAHFWGFDLHNPEHVDTEGWYWKENNSSWDNKFLDTNLFVVPYNGNSLELKARIASMKTNTAIYHHKVSISLNDEKLSEKEYPLEKLSDIEIKAGNINFIAGFNNIGVSNLPYYSQSQPLEPNSIMTDYFELKGKALPVTDTGLINFDINNLSEPGKLEVKNFRDNNVIIIDKEGAQISINPRISPGINIIAGANSVTGHSSLSDGRNRISGSSKRGFHVLVYKSPGFESPEYRFYESGSPDLQGYMSSLPSGSLVSVLYNNSSPAPADKVNLFSSYGGSQLSSAGANNPWFYAFTVNSSEFRSEKLGAGGLLYETVFYKSGAGKSYNAELDLNPAQKYSITASDGLSLETAKVFPVSKSQLRDLENEADLIYIYHSKFKNFADSMVAYRSKTHPVYKIKSVDIQDVYNEFYNGRKTAHAIKEFLAYVYHNWRKKPLFVTLLGDASFDPKRIVNTSINEDFIPSWGSPNSDYWYSLVDGDDYIADFIISRIPVNDDDESFSYLDKLKSYETTPLNLWMKKFLFLSGGDSMSEKEDIYGIVKYIGDLLTRTDNYTNRDLCMDTAYVRKHDITLVGESDADMILKEINGGVGWVVYYGHGSQRIFDMDGWTVDMFNNKNRYGLLTTLSCNTGSFASQDTRTRNEDFIFYPNAGFVAASGGTATGRSEILNEYIAKLTFLFKNPEFKYRTYGELIQMAKTSMNPTYDYYRFHMLEYLMIGDPLVKVRIPFESEIYTYPGDLTIKNRQESSIIIESDSLAIVKGIIKNQSMYKIDTSVSVKLTHSYNNSIEDYYFTLPELCKFDYYNFELDIKNKPGIHFITVTLDPDTELEDPDRSNNVIKASFEVFNQNLLPIEPMAFWDMAPENPVFRIINPLDNGSDGLFSYELKIVSDSADGTDVAKSSGNAEIYENYIEWKPAVVLESGRNYYLFARSIETEAGHTSSWLIVPFWANSEYSQNKAEILLKSNNMRKSIPDNMIFESGNQGRLVIPYIDHSYSVLGVSGTRGPGSDEAMRSQEMVYDGNRFLYTPPPRLGMNIALVSEKDYKVRYYPWWNWDMWLDWGQDPLSDTRSIEFVQFLRDSVKDDDYLFLATCEQAFFLPEAHNKYQTIGSLDTIKAELKKFGSTLADSLQLGCSFAMVGKRGMQKANDAFDIFRSDFCDYCGDTAKVTGTIREKLSNGSYTTPVFGNSDKWQYFVVSGYFPADSAKITVDIYGIAKGGSSTVLLISDSLPIIDLSAIDAAEYPKIQAVISMKRHYQATEPYIDEIKVKFKPSPEPAILKSSVKTSQPEIMRGETIAISGTAENISLRTPSAKTPFTVDILSENGDNIDILSKKADIGISGNYNFEFTNVTDFYRPKNNLKYVVNENDSINEQYSFNNTAALVFNVFEDTTKPYVEVYFDGVRLNNGDYVARKPKVEIKLFDNSKLPVKNTEDLKVLINSDYNWIFNLPDYKFNSLPRENTPEKATVNFTIDTLAYKHNIISVWFTDGSGNRDSTDLYFYISINGFIENAMGYPNPITGGNGNIGFYYKGPSQGAQGRVMIFNLKGQIVNELKGTVNIGNNSIPWDGRDQFGNSLPSGVYFYVIFVDTDVWVEQVTGKVLIVN